MSHKARMRGESGACNVCATPCSLCMHLSQDTMGSKTDEFSDETCRVNVASQYSVNGGDTSTSFKSKACDSLQHTTSETSNLISVNSSHDSLSENADSKATLRSSHLSDTLEVEMLPKLCSGGTTEEVELSPKPLRDLYSGAFASKDEDPKVEAHDDNISCVSRANDAYASVSNNSKNVDRKNLSCSSASVSSLGPEESKKVHESALSEMPSSNKETDAGSSSPKVQSPYFQLLSSKSFSFNVSFTDLEKDPSTDIQEKLPGHALGHIDSLLVQDALAAGVPDQKPVASKATNIPMNFCPKEEAGNINDRGIPTGEVLKCLNPGEQEEKSSDFDIREPPLQSVSGDDSDESDIVEHDVSNLFFFWPFLMNYVLFLSASNPFFSRSS